MKRPHAELRIGKVAFPLVYSQGRAITWWKQGSRRRYATAKSEPALKAKLQPIAAKILSGQIDAAQLEPADHRAYLAAREALAPWKIPVDLAAREYAAARADLPAGVALSEAIAFYKRHSGTQIIETNAGRAIDEFLQSLRGKGSSDVYLRMTEQDMRRFADFLRGPFQPGEDPPPVPIYVSEITPAQIESFLDLTGRWLGPKGAKVFQPAGPERRNGVRSTLGTFLNFCRARKYLAAHTTTATAAVPRRKTFAKTKRVWNPGHLRRALEIAAEHEPEWLPWLAFEGLSTIRTGAVLRMDWSDIHRHEAMVEVPAKNSKILRRFVVKARPALLAWLERCPVKTGPLCPNPAGLGDFTERLRTRYELPYRKNILRHSAISYRLAETVNDQGDPDLQRVAEEANTSVRKLKSNYWQVRTVLGELVTKDTAAHWYNTAPATAANVVQATFAL